MKQIITRIINPDFTKRYKEKGEINLAIRLNRIISLVIVFTLILAVIAGLISNSNVYLVFSLPYLLLLFIIKYLNFKGYVKSATLIFSFIVWLIITISAFYEGGINAPVLWVFIFLIYWVSINYDQRKTIVGTFMCIASLLFLVIAEIQGFLPKSILDDNIFIRLTNFVIEFLIVAITINMITRSLKNSLVDVNNLLKERLKFQEAIKESEEKYRTLLDHASIGIAVHSEGILKYANKTAAKILKYDDTEKLFGLEVINIVQPIHRKSAIETYRNMIEKKVSEGLVETKFVCSDGSFIDVEVFSVPLFFNNDTQIQVIFQDISERKKTQETILSQKEFLSKIVDNLPVGLYAKDVKNNYTYTIWNNKMEQLFGAKPREIIGKNDYDLATDKEEATVNRQNDEKVMYGNNTVEIPYEIVNTKDGSFHIHSIKVPIYDKDRKPDTLLGLLEDISERVKMETDLKESREFIQNERDLAIKLSTITDLKIAFDIVLDCLTNIKGIDSGGIYLINKENKDAKLIAYRGLSEDFVKEVSYYNAEQTQQKLISLNSNPLYQNYLKITPDIISPVHFIEGLKGVAILPVKYADKVIALINLASHTHDEIPLHSRNVIESIGFVIGSIIERIQTEEALRRSEEKFSKAFQLSPDAISISTLEDGRLIHFNEGFLQLSGYSSEELYGVSSLELNMWVNDSDRKYIVEQLKTHGEILNFETNARRKEGNIRTNLFSAKIIIINGQKCMLSYIRDITDRKQIEIEVIKAKERAELSDKLKTAFLCNMSHEIRTPMNGIIGFTEMLSEPDLPFEDRQKYSEIVYSNCQRLLLIINEIIDISKIEAGLVEVKEESVSLYSMFQELTTNYQPSANKLNLELDLKTDSINFIKTDKTKLFQILTNLIGNSLKFTQKGYIEVGYSQNGNLLEFYVKDTGIGIPQDDQSLIFERFRQLELGYTRKYGGAGIGLSIVKAYVELLGGEIWLQSLVNVGSTFYFTIPYKPIQYQTKQEKVIIVDLKQNWQNKTILIAEDEDENFKYVQELLGKTNIQILRAKDGFEAVEIVKTNPLVNLILMDIKMPNMSGIEATIEIKKLKPSLPVIAVTAFAFLDDKTSAFKAGCDDYLIKPIKPVFLIEAIKKYII